MTSTTATATTTSSSSSSSSTLVIGATGATGKYVVYLLLSMNQNVKVVVRSKQRMLELLDEIHNENNKNNGNDDNKKKLNLDLLQITEASFLDLSQEQIDKLIVGGDSNNNNNVTTVVSCLGHNMTFKGLYGKPRRLVTDSVKRCMAAIERNNNAANNDNNNNKKCKFILMGTDGVSHPTNDNPRSFSERIILFLLRYLLPPHSDNEQAAAYLLSYNSNNNNNDNAEWSIVRPTDLIDGPVSKYRIYSKPPGGLFGDGVCTRANVAAFMVQDLIMNPSKWEEYKFQMPVIHNEITDEMTMESKKSK